MNKKDHSKNYVNEHVVKLIALQVITITTIALFNHYLYLLFILTIDFAIRAFTYLPSPLALIAKIISKALGQKPKPVFAPPKKFAAAIGFTFSLAISILLLLNFGNTAYVIGGILIFCAFLEGVFNVCIGCYVYDWVVAPIVNRYNSGHPEAIKI
jgi:hypothetical protein